MPPAPKRKKESATSDAGTMHVVRSNMRCASWHAGLRTEQPIIHTKRRRKRKRTRESVPNFHGHTSQSPKKEQAVQHKGPELAGSAESTLACWKRHTESREDAAADASVPDGTCMNPDAAPLFVCNFGLSTRKFCCTLGYYPCAARPPPQKVSLIAAGNALRS